jgi:hypothetical protein
MTEEENGVTRQVNTSRFILRFRGTGPKPADVADRVRALPDARVLDDTPRMMLVEAPEQQLRELIGADRDWLIAPQRVYQHPDPRPAPRQAPPETNGSAADRAPRPDAQSPDQRDRGPRGR